MMEQMLYVIMTETGSFVTITANATSLEHWRQAVGYQIFELKPYVADPEVPPEVDPVE